jgi:hypothetical protein
MRAFQNRETRSSVAIAQLPPASLKFSIYSPRKRGSDEPIAEVIGFNDGFAERAEVRAPELNRRLGRLPLAHTFESEDVILLNALACRPIEQRLMRAPCLAHGVLDGSR